MLTPPFHFSIVACPLNTGSPNEILYRGATPAQRNFSHLARLRLKTIVYIRHNALDHHAPLSTWAEGRNVKLHWVKGDEMTEEKLGIGRTEIGEIIKIILDPTSYPVYIADSNGTSHTTLIIACLRKMQGWHIDSIIGEMCRFEPEYEDYSMVPFITSYLSGSEASFNLPPPPYPAWLWPQIPSTLALTRTITRERATSGSTATSTGPALLPFPHPLSVRKHPTMKITFPPSTGTSSILQSPLSPSLAVNSNTLARVPTRFEKVIGEENRPVPSSSNSASGERVNSGITGLSGNQTMDPDDVLRYNETNNGSQGGPLDKLEMNREMTMSTDRSYPEGEGSESDVPLGASSLEDEEEYEDEDEDEEEEEDEDEDLAPTSQYISALDLAGFG